MFVLFWLSQWKPIQAAFCIRCHVPILAWALSCVSPPCTFPTPVLQSAIFPGRPTHPPSSRCSTVCDCGPTPHSGSQGHASPKDALRTLLRCWLSLTLDHSNTHIPLWISILLCLALIVLGLNCWERRGVGIWVEAESEVLYGKLVENSHVMSLLVIDNGRQLRAMQRSRRGLEKKWGFPLVAWVLSSRLSLIGRILCVGRTVSLEAGEASF